MAEPAQSVNVTPLVCEECQAVWRVSAERWRMYLDTDDPPMLVTYCPECAEAEFG